jgi:hypothetical protein
LVVVTDRLAGLEAELLNVHVDFPLFQRMALPVSSGKSKIPGIKIQDTRMIRLMEVLLHGGPQLAGWRTAQIWQALQAAFSLSPQDYTLNQLRYDLRKMKGHDLLERVGKHYAYRLTEREPEWPPCSCSFTSASAAPWLTAYFITHPHAAPPRLSKSKPPITRAMPRFRTSLISWLLEKNLRDQFSELPG